MNTLLHANLLSPIVLAFALGVVARLMRSELRIPSTLYVSLSIYLLLALGLKGGHQLAEAGWDRLPSRRWRRSCWDASLR